MNKTKLSFFIRNKNKLNTVNNNNKLYTYEV